MDNIKHDYGFTAVPTKLMILLDNNCKSMLFSLIQLSSHYADENGVFFRTNYDLQQESDLSQKLVIATCSTLHRLGIITVRCIGKSKGKVANYYKVNFERFKEFDEKFEMDDLKNPEYKIATESYNDKKYIPSYVITDFSQNANNKDNKDIKDNNENIENIDNIKKIDNIKNIDIKDSKDSKDNKIELLLNNNKNVLKSIPLSNFSSNFSSSQSSSEAEDDLEKDESIIPSFEEIIGLSAAPSNSSFLSAYLSSLEEEEEVEKDESIIPSIEENIGLTAAPSNPSISSSNNDVDNTTLFEEVYDKFKDNTDGFLLIPTELKGEYLDFVCKKYNEREEQQRLQRAKAIEWQDALKLQIKDIPSDRKRLEWCIAEYKRFNIQRKSQAERIFKDYCKGFKQWLDAGMNIDVDVAIERYHMQKNLGSLGAMSIFDGLEDDDE